MEKLRQKFQHNRTITSLLLFIENIINANVASTGAELAYKLIMAFFPFIIFLLNVASFTPLGSQQVLDNIVGFLPEETGNLLVPIIQDIISSRSSALLSVSLILALWSGSSGIQAVMNSMNRFFRVKNKRNPISQKLIAVFYTLMLVLIILLLILGPIFGQHIVNLIGNYIEIPEAINRIILLAINLLPLPIMILGFGAFYKNGPGFPKEDDIKWKEAFIGAVATTVLFFVISFGFSFYVNNFGNYGNTYGALGGIIILLIWLFLIGIAIAVGAIVIITIRQVKDNKNIPIEKIY